MMQSYNVKKRNNCDNAQKHIKMKEERGEMRDERGKRRKICRSNRSTKTTTKTMTTMTTIMTKTTNPYRKWCNNNKTKELCQFLNRDTAP